MRIIIAKNSGFCMGVRMAMNTILKNAHESAEPLQTMGPLIHNPQTLELLRQKNVTAVDSPDEISARTVVIRTHGVPPEIEERIRKKGVRVLDSTCPHVHRIHWIIDEYRKKDFTILIYGDKGHAEVTGLLGYAGGKGILIQSPGQIAELPPLKRVCLVAQTTQSLSEYEKIKVLTMVRFPGVEIFDTICRATDNRQQEVEQLSRQVDALVVVGGKNSANSTRLYEIARKNCPNVLHIETEKELHADNFLHAKNVAVVSGASTPSWLISRVTGRLKEIGRSQRPWYLRLPQTWAEWFVGFNGYLAVGAMLMTWTALYLQSEQVSLIHMIVAGLYINSMYILNHLTNIRANQYEEIFKTDYILTHRRASMILLIATGLASVVLSAFLGWAEFVLVLLACVAGVLYHINIFPKNNLPFLKHRKLKDIMLSKDLGIAFAWSIVCVSVPYSRENYYFTLPYPDTIFTFLFIFVTVFIRTIFHDLQDIQRDMIVGRETIPIVMGKSFGAIFPNLFLFIAALIPFTGVMAEVLPDNTLLLVACPLYLYFIHSLFKANKLLDSTLFDAVVDFVFFLPFVLLLASRSLV